MTKYVQISDAGYVRGITNNDSFQDISGEHPFTYEQVSDKEAERIEDLMKARNRRPEGLYISELEIEAEHQQIKITFNKPR